ncbi:YidC/Oxa1 family membrane protein insertase [Oceanithermus sp.]|uniref:YidC/Oxa1 family membrane protein insertase n=1 Tax=Oceanithermus sp. TaxID=2268145 RepID=UPI0025804D56|nr:YidC/Oxa1 family membrane protein insertase [Oceanithermus sp.]
MKRLLLLFVVLLSPAFALTAEWQSLDVNGDGQPEHLAITNLADIAFNDRGQIVGWYVKQIKGQNFKGNYAKAPNLVKPGLPLPGTLVGYAAPAEGAVAGSGFNGDNARFFEDAGELVAEYRAPGAVMRYRINPRLYSLKLEVELDRPTTLIWTGINRSDNPITKLLLAGSDQPVPSGSGTALYAAVQTKANKGYAFVLRGKDPLETQLELGGGGATVRVALPAGATELSVYGGLNELVRLYVEGFYELPGLFKPNIWGQLSLGLLYVMELAYTYTTNWGLAILLLTIFVRLLLWPLMHQQFKSMAEMNKIKPLMDEINKKFKDDPEKKNEALMNLYREHKINPAAGCLPMFIQMPILFMMWRVIANYEFDQGFLWIPDLSLPDPFYILPALYVLVMLAQTMLMSHGNKDAMRQGIMMNLIFIFLVLKFPAGVTLYWVFSTLIGLVQQWMINKQLGIATAARS